MTTQPNTRNTSINNPNTSSFAALAPKLDSDMEVSVVSALHTAAQPLTTTPDPPAKPLQPPSPSYTTLRLPARTAVIKFSKRPTKGSTRVATALAGKRPREGSRDSTLTTIPQSCNPCATPSMSANAAHSASTAPLDAPLPDPPHTAAHRTAGPDRASGMDHSAGTCAWANASLSTCNSTPRGCPNFLPLHPHVACKLPWPANHQDMYIEEPPSSSKHPYTPSLPPLPLIPPHTLTFHTNLTQKPTRTAPPCK
ncbi:hypothetical protein B0H34DRAFT_801864 [Crassisporium funariophilum]|nr:hypothetical protein B0H34DRAFT_801864 [Crassisporium funariophilum]